CGSLVTNRYFTLLTVRRFTSSEPIIRERRVKRRKQTVWEELANLSYGQATINHRKQLNKTLLDLRRVFENRQDSVLEEFRELKIVEIGSFAMGTSTRSSDLDVLIIPYSNDRTDERIDVFNLNMENWAFRRKRLFQLERRLSKVGITKERADVILRAKVPIVQGITRSGVHFDMQFGMAANLFSSNFVRLAFQLDPRLVLVYHWLRAHAVQKNLFGGKSNLFTAFHLYMLIVHFAQATKILPVLMDEYADHLSTSRYELVKEYMNGKNVAPPLYTTKGLHRWAPDLTNQLVEYYAPMDFTKVEINVGRGTVKERSTVKLLLIEPFLDQENGVCRIQNGAALMNKLFLKIKDGRDG
ncbi:hypothetical protein PMAYCL1PPCAC_13898, partial [Pristionchus mayeri]